MQHGTLDIPHTRHMRGKKLVGKDGKKKYILNQAIGINKKERERRQRVILSYN